MSEEVVTKNIHERMMDEEDDNCDDDCQFIFPQRLMSILGDERNHDAICWLPHGRAFIIRNRKLFAERVMPKFFPRKSKYSSFTRKLNRWNFVRVSSGLELGAYYHEFFLRDKPHLAAQMFCKNARTKIAMASSDPSPTTTPSNVTPAIVESQPAVSTTSNSTSNNNNSSNNNNKNNMEAAQMMMMYQQLDPSMMFLLDQQLQLGQQQLNGQLQQQQLLRQQLSLLQGAAVSPALAMEMQLQKQQQERMLQLRQLMALKNLKNQQQRKNAPRASAA